MMFSIITVSYNSEKTIARTIQSVLSQSCRDYEYIIVDGASTDATMDIVKTYETKFEGRLRYVSEPDRGIYDAMNKGISMAKGDIIGIVNSDDWLEDYTLEELTKSIGGLNENETVMTGDIRYHYNDGSTQIISYTQKELKHYAKVWRLGVNHPATFVPRAIYEKFGVFDINIRLQADSDFIDRLYHNGVPFVFINKVLSNQSDGGASTNNFDKSLRDYKYILSKNVPNGLYRFIYYAKYWFAMQIKKNAPTYLLKLHRN